MRTLLLLIALLLPVELPAQVGGLRSPAFVAALAPRAAGGSAPSAPSNPGVTVDSGNLLFTWADNSSDELGFDIWCGVDGGAVAPFTSAAANEGSVQIGVLGDGKVYVCKVRATNTFGASAFTASRTNDVFADATHYWTLNEVSGNNRVDSIGAVTLSENTLPVNSAAGIKDNAASFTVLTGILSSDTITFTRPYTISLWIKLTSNNDNVITKLDDGSDGAVEIRNPSVEDVIFFETEGGNSVISNPIGTGAWHHFIVVVPSSGTLKVSIDAVAFITGDTASAGELVGTFNIGSSFFGGGNITGLIDEPSIWPRAISIAEVISIYGGGTAPRFKP